MIITVSQYGNLLKGIIESEPIVARLTVRGEIAEFKRSSDICWFTVKDEFSRMGCFAYNVKENLQVGEVIVITGTPSYYQKSGNLSFYVSEIKRENRQGDNLLKLLKLKEKLEAEGLFAKKREVDRFAAKIGVVTSPTGAAVRDIINVAGRRNPGVSIVVFPCKVQGEGASEAIAEGVRYFSQSDVETVIVARGGGGKEDLNAFNDEALVRAIYCCEKPVISAVGHEIDYTLCDFAADLRAPTPSAAAELATVDMGEALSYISSLTERAKNAVKNRLEDYEFKLNSLLKSCRGLNEQRLFEARARLSLLSERAKTVLLTDLKDSEAELNRLTHLAEAYSPMKLLRKGMAALSVGGEDATEELLQEGVVVSGRMRNLSFDAKVIKTEYIEECEL